MYYCLKHRIVLDGNIGSGKTTQLKLLSSEFGTVTEPINEWPLDMFYNDRSRWAFLLQMTILSTFNKYSDGLIYERSPYSSFNVFWRILLDDGLVNEFENSVCSTMYSTYGWRPSLHIYIRTRPEECYDRIKSRFQDGDGSVSLEYLEKVHEYHEKYVVGPDTHVIDGSESAEKIHEQILQLIKDDMHRNQQERGTVQEKDVLQMAQT